MTFSRRRFLQATCGAAVLAALPRPAKALPAGAESIAGARPNIIFILADDVGFGDMGWLFQNSRAKDRPAIKTPNFDRAAAEGITLRDHYSPCPVCAPSRASLMTGTTQGHCSLRNNQFDRPIADDLTLGRVMKAAGYATYAVGKWGIGGGGESGYPLEAHPLDRGFDRYYGFLFHLAGHTYYHFDDYLGANKKLYMGVFEDREKATETADGVYSTDLFTARVKKYIVDHTQQTPDKPFFVYYAINTIHGSSRLGQNVPNKRTLHVPGRPYPGGAGLNGGVQWPVDPEPKEDRNTWIHPDYRELKPEMARYATGIRRMDDAFGDLVQLLKDLKIDDNTLIVFTSDNGPAGENGADPRFFDSAGPFDGMKRDCFEGGVREPTLARWPGKIKPGVNTSPSGFWDWMPTFAMLGGLPPPAHSDGVSLLPTLTGEGTQRPSVIYTEYAVGVDGNAGVKDIQERKAPIRGQQQMVRVGDYVAIRTQIKDHNTPIRLYNVVKDPHQDHDLASDPAQAERVTLMTKRLLWYRRPDEKAKRPYDNAFLAPVEKKEGFRTSVVIYRRPPVDYPWVPDFSQSGLRPVSIRSGDPDQPINAREVKLSAANDYAIGGLLRVTQPGTYTFTLSGSGGAHLRLHGAALFGTEKGESIVPREAVINLDSGLHPLTLFSVGDVKIACPALSLMIEIG